jgi:DNA-binding NtrC family response regulator
VDFESIDVLATDLGLARARGAELARAAARRHPGLPVLFMSGGASAEDAAHAYRGGPSAALAKPFAPAALETAILRLVGV